MTEKQPEKKTEKYCWLIAMGLACLAMPVLFALARVLSFEKYILLAGDSFEIYAADMKMFARSILNGESIWYSFSTQMGLNTALSVAFKLFSPFNVLYLIFPKADINVITAIIIILKTGLAAAAFQIYSAKVLNRKGIDSILFAVFYAMSSYVVVYCIINFMWLDGVYMLPIVALAVHKAACEKKYTLLTVSFAYLFIVQFYQGYMIGIFAAIYFVLLLVTGKGNSKKKWFAALRFLVATFIAILISAFVWLPVVFFLKNHYASDSTGFESIGISLIQVFDNLFWGKYQDYYWSPYVYCGLPCLLLLPFYFMNGKIRKKEKLTYGILLLFFLVSCIFLPLFALLHGFDAPDMWNFRFTFILSFLLCTIACRQSDYVKEIPFKYYLLYVGALAAFYLLEAKLNAMILANGSNVMQGFWLNFLFIAAWTGVVYAEGRFAKFKKPALLCLVLLMMTECISNSQFAGIWNDSLMEDKDFSAWEENNASVLARISEYEKEDGDAFYRAYVINDMTDNGDSYFGYYGISDFGTEENENLRGLLKSMGLYSVVRRTSVTGMTPPLEMLLSVKYAGRLPEEVKKTEFCLPIGFMAEEAVLEEIALTDNVFENQNSLFAALSGMVGPYVRIDDENIAIEENNVYLIGEGGNTFYKQGTGEGSVTYRVKGVSGDVYTQISYSGNPEVIKGIYVEKTENIGLSGYCWGQIPFAAKMAGSKEDQHITYYALSDMPVAFATNGIYVYELEKNKLKDLYENLSAEPFVPEECKNGYVKGRVLVESDRRVLFTTIPYTEGWTAFVNGRQTNLYKAANQAFTAVRIPDAGEYEIELKYHCPGTREGILLCVFGVLLFIGSVLFDKSVKGREKKKHV